MNKFDLSDLYHPLEDDYLPFQKAGIIELLGRKNVLLADDMGLGKTIQTIGYINHTRPTKVLIVCPNNLRLNWRREIETWMDPSLREKYDIEDCTSSWYMDSNFIIASYEGLAKWGTIKYVPCNCPKDGYHNKLHVENCATIKTLRGPLNEQEYDLFIADEAHFMKTPSAQRSIAGANIKASKKIFLTGTPIVNYPHELFPLVHALDYKQFPSFKLYATEFLSYDQKHGRNLVRLQAWLRNGVPGHAWGSWGPPESGIGLMVRRLKKDVLPELPRKRRQVIELPAEGRLLELVQKEKQMWAGQQDISDQLAEALELLKEAEDDSDFEKVIESLKFTRKYFFDEIAIIRHELAKAKVPYVCEHIEDVLENREKLVVFVHHHDVGRAIYDHFRDVSVLVSGEVAGPARDERIQKFWQDDNCKLFIGSLKVTGLGLNLQVASHVVFAELDWVPGVITQAEDRCHRIGQEKSLLVQHLVAEDSMDSNMAKRIIAKQKSINKALNRGAVED